MNWFLLVLAGLFEVAFAITLKLSDGFTRVAPSILFVVFALISFGLLSQAIKTIPVGTAYAIWTGIGATGTAILGMLFFNESTSIFRIGFIGLLIFSIVGLKLLAMFKG